MSEDVILLMHNPESPIEAIIDAITEGNNEGYDMRNVYVIVHTHGSYSDKRDYYISAYLDKQMAVDKCDKYNAWLGEHNIFRYGDSRYKEGKEELLWMSKEDLIAIFSTAPDGIIDRIMECEKRDLGYKIEMEVTDIVTTVDESEFYVLEIPLRTE